MIVHALRISHNMSTKGRQVCDSATFKLTNVHEDEIAKHILSIESNATFVDSINMDMIIKTLPRTLSVITTNINKSIESSTDATLRDHPIPKNHPGSVKGLRPISNLTCLSKILERAVYGQLIRYCKTN